MGALVAIRIGFIAAPAPNRRWRPRRLLISIGGRFVSVAIRPASDTAIAPREGPSVAPVIAVRTAIASVTITPLVIFAFDVATLVNKARSRVGMAAPIAAARGAPTVVAVGRVAVAWVAVAAAVAVGTGIGTVIGTVIGIVIVTSLRRCCDHERTEQCEDACYDQCQSAAPWRASGSRTVHGNLQHASA